MNHEQENADRVASSNIRAGAPNPSALNVLLVEDNSDIAQSLARLLQVRGHNVRIAPDGVSASRAVQEGLPDVVLLDIGLPGIDGYEVARRITNQPSDKRPLFIAVTGRGEESDRQQSAEAGIDLHLVKPVDPKLLLGLLSRFQSIIG